MSHRALRLAVSWLPPVALALLGGGCARTVIESGSGGSGGGSTSDVTEITGGTITEECVQSEVAQGVPCKTAGKMCGWGGTSCYPTYVCQYGKWQETLNNCGPFPKACPMPPTDQEVEQLLGAPCSSDNQTCASNNGCGGCSVTCKNGVWTQLGEQLCYSVGPTC